MPVVNVVGRTKRAVRVVVGFVVLLAGMVMLVIPGPGWLAIVAGLAILSAEYHWARRLLVRLKRQGARIRDALRTRSR